MNCTNPPEQTGVAPKPVNRPALDRLERLVNNEQFADVAFRVGEPGELMFGHKAVLAEASEVFRAQFAGAFRESREDVREQPIPIVDIEPAVFKEVLRYMYSDRVNVTADNVVDVYYSAEKYLLEGLKKTCIKFLAANLTEGNVLGLFDRNRQYELEEVNRFCLDIICENPIKVFADESFFWLSAKSVELIGSQEFLNCQTDQLLVAIDKWVKANQLMEGANIVSKARELKTRGLVCKKMHNFAGGYYSSYTPQPTRHYNQQQFNYHHPFQPSTINYHYAPPTPVSTEFVLKITAKSQISIYGLGICIKSKEARQTITLNVTVTCCGGQVCATKRTVTAKEDISIEEVLFERQTITNGNELSINVHMQHGTGPVYCLKDFEPENPEIGMCFTSHSKSIPGYYRQGHLPSTDCCVYYVLYNPGCGVNLQKLNAVNC
uniref:BTB domain-containing protein n=1 Tax=Culex tarsalis TaxID=7177 RepID=A0A1Q3EZV7_CULTA